MVINGNMNISGEGGARAEEQSRTHTHLEGFLGDNMLFGNVMIEQGEDLMAINGNLIAN